MRLVFLVPLLLLWRSAQAQAIAPRIFYTDLDSGPNSGGENNAGAFVSIYGRGFGSTRGTSNITAGAGSVDSYRLWSDTKVTVQLGAAATSGDIVVTTVAGASNGMPFTVRPGGIYFVANAGSDAASGGFSSPWRTILMARDSAKPGDVIYVREGVAQVLDDQSGWSACMTLDGQAGTPGNPIAMVVYPGESATIGSVTGCDSGIRNEGHGEDYWTLAGFNLRGVSEALTTAQVSHWRVIANDLTCPNGDGASACYETGLATYLNVYGNNVHDTGALNASALYQGVYFSTDSNHVDFGWNTIANVHGCRGLQIHSSPLGGGGPDDPTGHNQYDLRIHDNVIHDTQCDGMVIYTVDPSKGPVEIYNNLIYNAGKGPNNPEGSGVWSCIFVASATNTGPLGSGTVEVYNNTMFGCGTFADPPYEKSSGGVIFAGPDPGKNIRLRNNVIVMTTAQPYVLGDNPDGSDCLACSRISGSNNLFYGAGQFVSDGALTDTVLQDPLFVDSGAFDFHLQASSPAANAGTPTPTLWDIEGTPFGSSSSIGAYAPACANPRTLFRVKSR